MIDILGSTERMSEEMLNKHFDLLYTVLEPRDIANVMLQEGQIHAHHHDDITNNRKKYKRLEILLKVLKKKELYTCFACILESLEYTSLLETLNNGAPYINILCKYIFLWYFIPPLCSEHKYLFIHRLFVAEDAVCIQHNFTTLQDELPGSDHATKLMENVLSESNVLDIESCNGAYRKKAKLLKILILNGQVACQQLFESIRSNLKREDLIQKMINHVEDISRRGNILLFITYIKI